MNNNKEEKIFGFSFLEQKNNSLFSEQKNQCEVNNSNNTINNNNCADGSFEPPRKRQRTGYVENCYHNDLSSIIDISGDNWLIEWTDRTRTWECYDDIKILPSFRKYIEFLILRRRNSPSPSYIS